MNYTKHIESNSGLLFRSPQRVSSPTILPQHSYFYHPAQSPKQHFGDTKRRIQYNTHMITPDKITHHPTQEKQSLTVLVRNNPQEEDPSIPKICSRGGVKAPFPVKLMDLLNIVDDHPFDYDGTSPRSIISWQPDGKCFRVHDKVLFEKHIQHRYFEQTNYTSFRRQLNLWGFKRIAGPKTGTNFGAYYHPQFTRDDKYSCRLMRRPSSTKSSSKKTKSTSSSSSNNNKKKNSCKNPRSQSERVVTPRDPPHSPTAVAHADMQMWFSVPSSNNNYSRMSKSYGSSSSTSNFKLSRSNPSHMVTSIEEACSYVQKWDEEMMTVVADDSSNSTTVIENTKFHDSFDEKIMRTLLEDESEESQVNRDEDFFQLPDCEPIQEEEADVGVGSMEISLSNIY